MDSIYVLRGRLEELYGRNSKVYDKVLQFILAMITFVVINNHVGFMKAAASPVVSFGLAVVCTFLPLPVTVVIATALILLHMYAVTLGIFAMTAALFLIMYIFYLRLAPKMAVIVLLTPIAFFSEDTLCDPCSMRADGFTGKPCGYRMRSPGMLYDGICEESVCKFRRRGYQKPVVAGNRLC